MNAEQIANGIEFDQLTKMEAIAFEAMRRAYDRMRHWENTPVYATNVAEYHRIRRRWEAIDRRLSALQTTVNGAVDRGEM